MTLALLTCLALAAGDDEYRVEKGEGACLLVLTVDGDPHDVAASPDGRTLAVAGGSSVYFVDPADGKLLRRFDTGRGTVRGLAWSPDGTKVAAATVGGLYLVDASTGKAAWKAPGHPYTDPRGEKRSSTYGAAFSADGKTVVTVSMDEGRVRTWSAADGSPGRVVETKTEYLERIIRTPSGYVVAEATVIIGFDENLAERWRQRSRGLGGGIAASPDGKRLALGVAGGGAHIAYLDPATGKDAGAGLFVDGTGGVAGLAFTRDGARLVAATTRRGVVKVWKTAEGGEGTLVAKGFEAQKDAHNAATILLDGKVVAVAGDDDDQVRLYRLPE